MKKVYVPTIACTKYNRDWIVGCYSSEEKAFKALKKELNDRCIKFDEEKNFKRFIGRGIIHDDNGKDYLLDIDSFYLDDEEE